MEIIISRTGRQNGAGSDPYKWVSGLTAAEREHTRHGTALVVVTGCPTHAGNPPYRVVVWDAGWGGGRTIPRLPRTPAEGAAVRAALGL